MHLINLGFGLYGRVALVTGQWGMDGLLLSYWVITGLGSLAVCHGARQRLSAHGFVVTQHAWAQALWTPAVTLLALVNISVSFTTRTITQFHRLLFSGGETFMRIDDSATYSPKVALLQSPLAYARRAPLLTVPAPLEEG